MNGKEILTCVTDILFPRVCPVCNNVLTYQEPYLCISCLEDIPLTRLHDKDFNELEQLLAGKIPIEKASSLFYYIKGSKFANILHDVKYKNRPYLAKWLTFYLSQELYDNDFFADIDYLLPIPLHKLKKSERGYNQSYYIAKGIAECTKIPISEKLIAHRSHSTQTRKGRLERWENTQDIFKIKDAELFQNKHVLLIDDVITTGATILSASRELHKIPGVKISVLSMALARI